MSVDLLTFWALRATRVATWGWRTNRVRRTPKIQRGLP